MRRLHESSSRRNFTLGHGFTKKSTQKVRLRLKRLNKAIKLALIREYHREHIEKVRPVRKLYTLEGQYKYLDRFSGAIKQLSSTAQLTFWKDILACHSFNLTQLNDLRGLIEDRIQFDIISAVPYEIALYIMTFLEPKDICQAALTCRSWRTVCEDNRLWREKCSEEGLLNDETTAHALFKGRLTRRNRVQGDIVNTLLTGLPKSEYKTAYMKHIDILRNWRHRKFDLTDLTSQTNLSQDAPNGGNDNRLAPPDSDIDEVNKSQGSISDQQSNQDYPASVEYNLRSRRVPDKPNSFEKSVSDDSVLDGNPSPPNSGENSRDFINQSKSSNNRDRNNLIQLRCHEDSVITCLQYNPRTNVIVSGSDDQTLKVWSSETGRCLATLEGHSGGVWSSQLSPDDIVISGSTDRTLRIWKAHTGKLVHCLQGHTSTVRCLALDGRNVVSGSRDTTLRLWNIDTGLCINVFTGHGAAVRCVEYKNDVIVSGAYDYAVMVWDAKTSHCIHVLERHIARIYSLQFDGQTIASGSLDQTICLWDADTGSLRHQLAGHTSLTSKMQLKGNLLVSANADSLCKIWDIRSGKCLHTLGGKNKHGSAITSVYFDNRHVVTSSDDGTVKLWDLKTGQFIRNLIVLPTASNGGVVWRIRASYTKLICAVGSRAHVPEDATEDTHLLVLNFNE